MGEVFSFCVNDHSISRVTISPLRSYIGFPRLHCSNNRWIQAQANLFAVVMHWVVFI
jgi:hypothetical protein